MGSLLHHLNSCSLAGKSEGPPPTRHVHMLFPRHCPSPPPQSLGWYSSHDSTLKTYGKSQGKKITPNAHGPPSMCTYRGPELFKKYQHTYLSSFSWSWALRGGGSYKTKAPSSSGSWRARRTPALLRPNAREPRGPRDQQYVTWTSMLRSSSRPRSKCLSFS